jgi:hypothetical protein
VKYRGLNRVRVLDFHEMLTEEAGTIGHGGNSGFQAINLAVQFGAKKIILVGFDMNLGQGMHWHGKHPSKLNNPNVKNVAHWRRRLDAVAPQIAAVGVQVLNASPVSALTAYPKMTFEEALRC